MCILPPDEAASWTWDGHAEFWVGSERASVTTCRIVLGEEAVGASIGEATPTYFFRNDVLETSWERGDVDAIGGFSAHRFYFFFLLCATSLPRVCFLIASSGLF